MTPLVNGTVHHFEYAGLYDGVSMFRDYETRSLWNHITGECMYGPLAGQRLPTFNLLQMKTRHALEAYPDLEIALSNRRIAGERGRWSPWAERIPVLGERFKSTMAPEDTRRPTMDVGIGVWTEGGTNRFYPMEYIVAAGNVIVDDLDGRSIAVFYEPGAQALSALYVNATDGEWEGNALRLDSGQMIRDGVLFDANGKRGALDRPMQLFTRWYGYALAFENVAVFEPGG